MTTVDANLEVLRQARLFRGLGDEVLSRFASNGQRQRYAAGELVFMELSEGDEIYVIAAGHATAELALANADDPFEVVTLGPGEVVGEVSFIQQGPRSATVTAKDDLELIAWKAETWRRMCDEDHTLGYHLTMAIAQALCERLRGMNERMLDNVAWGLV